MKLTKKMVTALMCAATLTAQTVTALPTVNAAEELADSLANDSGLEFDYARALQYSIYFYDANMCGDDVEGHNRYKWRGNCHTYDAHVPLHPIEDWVGVNLTEEQIEKYRDLLDPDGDGTVDVAGGFHDAGDHVEFGMPENYAASTVGWGYYEFRDSYIKIGEQEHIETILRHFNDYLMKCTFRDKDGKVVLHCYQVGDGDIDHKFWNSPEMDEMGRPAFFLTEESPQIDYAASAAASLAINYLNFKDTDKEYAEKSLDYAKALFQFAEDHPGKLSVNGDGPKGYYQSSKWEDDFCWAGAWLYKITGDHKYLEDIYTCYDYYAAPTYVHCWNDVWGGAQCILGEISMDKPMKEGEHVYPNFIEEFKEAANKSPYEEMDCWASVEKAINTYMSGGVGTITPAGYWWLNTWGSARYNTAAQLMALVYTKYHGNTPGKYSDWAQKQMHYIMGDNPMKRSYIVGYNENSVKFPHHRACSGLTKCEDPDEHRYVLYGALAGGPDAKDNHIDVTSDWIYNEVTIDYNAAFVGASAGLYAFYGTDDMAPTKNFPPDPKFSAEGEGGTSYWVTACGIDEFTDTGAGVTKVSLYVMGSGIKKPEDLSVRYYFSGKELSDPMAMKGTELYDQAQTEAAPADGHITGPYKYDKMSDIYYFEIKWDDYNIANSGKKYQFSMGIYYGEKWDPTNDPSYKDLKIFDKDAAFFDTGNEVKTDYICVYEKGVLIGGIEPDGSTPVIEDNKETTTTTTAKITTTTTTTKKVTTTTTTEATTTTPKPTTTTTTRQNVNVTTTTNNSSTSNDDPDSQETRTVELYGDANCDGGVDMADAVLIMQYISNPNRYGLNGNHEKHITAQGLANADCSIKSGPNGVTVKDAQAVQRNLLGACSLPVNE